MKKNTFKILKLFIWLLFILYLFILINVIVLKGINPLKITIPNIHRSFIEKISAINFIPFKTILYYLGGNEPLTTCVKNILGNIFAFSPLGFLLPILFKKCKKIKHIFFVSFILSLSIEITQVQFYLGSCDIDDIILNVSGAILGFAIYQVILRHRWNLLIRNTSPSET